MLNKQGNMQNFLGCNASYEEAKFVIFGVPFDSTTSNRPGARFGPSAMRLESYGLETYSPYLDRDLEDISVYDAGDLEPPFGCPEPMLEAVQSVTAEILKDGKIPVMIGGEHLVTLGAVRAAVAAHPNLHIIHFDAHADLRDDYLGESLSHATVMRRCMELGVDDKIYQYGIRSGTRDEFKLLKTLGETPIAPNAPIYLTLDLDVLDPSVMPGTGTTEAGGLNFAQLLELFMGLALDKLNVVGFDIVELAPNYDPSGISVATACKILRELLLTIGRN